VFNFHTILTVFPHCLSGFLIVRSLANNVGTVECQIVSFRVHFQIRCPLLDGHGQLWEATNYLENRKGGHFALQCLTMLQNM